MSNATMLQGAHTLTLLARLKLGAEDLAILHDGYLTDLARAVKKRSVPTREVYQDALNLLERPQITVDYNLTLEEMRDATGFCWDYPSTNRYFTSELFKLSGKGVIKREIRLFDGYRLGRTSLSPDFVIGAILNANRADPWRPAAVEDAFAFGKAYPHAQTQRAILCLGSSCMQDPQEQAGRQSGAPYRVWPCLGWGGRSNRDAVIDLSCPCYRDKEDNKVWSDSYQFLAVRDIVKNK
jgi:hypothetical protein